MYSNNGVITMFEKVLKIFYEPYLVRKQKKVNEMLEAEGFTDKVLSEQLYINKKRNQLDLKEVKGWAQ